MQWLRWRYAYEGALEEVKQLKKELREVQLRAQSAEHGERVAWRAAHHWHVALTGANKGARRMSRRNKGLRAGRDNRKKMTELIAEGRERAKKARNKEGQPRGPMAGKPMSLEDVTLKGDCTCREGFAMNLSCPVHRKNPVKIETSDQHIIG